MNKLRIAAEAFLPAKYTRDDWARMEVEAQQFMEARARDPAADTYLIAIASQHPSIAGRLPHPEYKLRLDEAIRLAQEIAQSGGNAELAVFDSRHRDDTTGGVEDLASLADIGKAYLISRGFPQVKIHSVWTDLYKNAMGGYNGGDEAFAASRAFEEHDYYRKLYFVLSPEQQSRARANFIANGVLPHFRIPRDISDIENPYHGSDWTNYLLMRITRRRDPDWQGPNSLMARATREARIPAGGIESKIAIGALVDLCREQYGESAE